MAVKQESTAAGSRLRFETHWRLVSWALLDKSLLLVYGFAFLVIVARVLPEDEFGLMTLATTVFLTASQLLKSLLLVPMIKFEAEGRAPQRVVATGALLYAGACALVALLLWGGREVWAAAFDKPSFASVLVPTAALLLAGCGRDAANASLEGMRRLRAVFFLDLFYYTCSIIGLVIIRGGFRGRDFTATLVQWTQAGAVCLASLASVAAARSLLLARPSRAEAARIGHFGIYFFGSGLGATLVQQADVVLAGRLMDTRQLAAYGIAKQLFRGFNALAQALNQVLMPLVSRLHAAGRHTDLRVLFEKSVCFLQLALFPVCVGLIVASRPLFDLLYKGRYPDSVPIFQILVASALTLPLASVGSPFLTAMGHVRSLLWMTWAGLTLGVGLALLWIPQYGPVGAASSVLVAATFGLVVRTVALQRLLGFSLGSIAARSRDAVDFVRRRLDLHGRRSAG